MAARGSAPNTSTPQHLNTAFLAVVTALLSTVLLAGCGSGLKTGGPAVVHSGANPGVFPPNSVAYGKTYGEWSAAWWQWVLPIPGRDNPNADPTGEKCHVGQSGDVWFLAGTTGGVTERTCTLPTGKAVFFPIVNTVFWDPFGVETLDDLRREAKDWIDHVTELEASVDGVSLQGLRNYRSQPPAPFEFIGPPVEEDPLFGPLQAGTQTAVADGFYLMLQPFAPGPHTITFRGKIAIPAVFPSVQVFETIVTYHLTVQ
jgi:hypothetical protein